MTSVCVIVPVYNEGESLGANLVSLADHFAMYTAYDFSYVIVDDGSTDRSAAVAHTFARFRRNVTVVSHERNYGLGRAMRTGIAHAQGDVTVVLDADLSYRPTLAMQLLETLDSEKADIVTASAYMRGGRVVNVPVLRKLLSREANRLLSFATAGRYKTLTCMVRAYRTDFLKSLPFRQDGMEAVAELMLLAIRKNGRIVEIPAKLEWSEERRSSRAVPSLRKTARQTLSTAKLAFGHRPALWLALPGLIPGSWPLVVGILLLMHASAKEIAIGSIAILTVQYASLAIFAGQLGQFFARGLFRSDNEKYDKLTITM